MGENFKMYINVLMFGRNSFWQLINVKTQKYFKIPKFGADLTNLLMLTRL